jgi:hypothetical protein
MSYKMLNDLGGFLGLYLLFLLPFPVFIEVIMPPSTDVETKIREAK